MSQFGVDSRTSPTIHLRPLHHPHPDHPPKNDRDDTSGDETVAGRIQCLPEEEIGNRGEDDVRQHGVKHHNAGIFCNVESEIHSGWIGYVVSRDYKNYYYLRQKYELYSHLYICFLSHNSP